MVKRSQEWLVERGPGTSREDNGGGVGASPFEKFLSLALSPGRVESRRRKNLLLNRYTV